MKKILLSLLCLLAAVIPAMAADVTINMGGTWAPALPTAYNTSSATTHTSGNVTLTVFDAKVLKNGSSTALILTKGSGYIQLPAFDKKVASFTVSSQSGASATAVVNITEGDGTTTIGSFTTTTPGTDTYTVTIPADKQKTGVAYRFKPTSSKNAQIAKIEVTFAAEDPNTVATPVINPSSKEFTESFIATISCATEGATIHYTLDDTEPTVNSPSYIYAIQIDNTATIKAMAVKDGMNPSAVATAEYTYLNAAQFNCANIAEWITKATADQTHTYTITNAVTVTYNGNAKADNSGNQYTFIKDDSGSLLVFGVKNSLTAGQTLTGLSGSYGEFGGSVQMTGSNVAALTPGAGTAPEPALMQVSVISAADLSKYVKVENVSFNPTTKKISQNGAELDIYYRFGSVQAPTAAGDYTIEGLVAVYNGTVQIYPTKFTEYTQPSTNTIAWSAEKVEFAWQPDYTTLLPTLSNPGNAAVTYESSDATIATIDAATGAVTLVKPGTVTISAKSGETTVSYILTVSAVDMVAEGLVKWVGLNADGGFTAIMNGSNAFPTISVAEGYNLIGVVYNTFNVNPAEGYTGDVATVNNEGVITLVNPGTVNINYVWGAANPFIAPNACNYLLTVVSAPATNLTAPVIEAYMSTDMNQVQNDATIAKTDAPVYISVENNNADTTMDVYVMKATSKEEADFSEFASVEGFSGDLWNCTKQPKDPGYYYVSAMVMDADGNSSIGEFGFTIAGDVVKTYINPIVSFLDEAGDAIEATTAEAPVKFVVENQNPSGLGTSIYYAISTDADDLSVMTKSDENVEVSFETPGTYSYKAYIATYDGDKLTGTSATVEGTFTVTAAGLKAATFAATDKDGAEVASGASVAEDKTPVTLVVTNPNAGSNMEISVANLSTGRSNDYSTTESTYTLTFDKSAEYAIGAYIWKDEQDAYAEFTFTIEGEVEVPLQAPYVEFLNDDYDEVPSPCTQLPVTMYISNQDYYEGVEMVYTINGETVTTDEHSVEIPLTEPGVIEYSVYVKMGTKSVSQTVEGTYEITADAVKLAAPVITFTTPEGETEPVTVTITNPNLNGAGTIVYSVGTGAWFEGEGNPVTFTLPNDGVYTVRAYVRNDRDETLNSDITVEQYVLDGIEAVGFGSEGIKVVGGHILAPADAQVYSISGQAVSTLDRVAAGIYIVRLSNGKTAKVIVK